MEDSQLQVEAAKKKIAAWYRESDWRNPKDYPDPKKASSDRWAWEFLRRNTEFQKDSADFEKIAKDHPWSDRDKTEVGAHPLEIKRDQISKRWKIRLWVPHQWVEEKPGDYDAPCLFDSGVADNLMATYRFNDSPERAYHIAEHKPSEFLYRINLNWPIAPQMEIIKRHAQANQSMWEANGRPKPQINKRLHIAKFPAYLRAFDANKSGALIKDIADVWSAEKLEGNCDYEKTARNALAAAERFIGGEYIFIPMMRCSK